MFVGKNALFKMYVVFPVRAQNIESNTNEWLQ